MGRRWTGAWTLLALAAAVWIALAWTTHAAPPAGAPTVEVFARAGCPRCAAARVYLAALEHERPGLRVLYHDVAGYAAGGARLARLAAAHGVAAPGVPAFLVRGEWFFVGFVSAETTGARLRAALDAAPGAAVSAPSGADGVCTVETTRSCPPESAPRGDEETVTVPLLGRLDARRLGLPLFTLAIGLLDGFNPCAMWVLLLLLSFLVALRDRRKVLVVGGTFVLMSGLVYFAFMAAWLNVFLLIGLSRALQAVLGLVALVVGAVNIKDFFAFKRGASLSIPEAAKPGLYRHLRAIVRAENLPAAAAAAAVLAALVNLIELLCTAGFPAVYTRVLTLHHLPRWQYYAYLALYNVAYIADDTLVLTIAVVTLSSRKLQQREGRWLKLVSGVVMAALGVVLLVRPQLLS